MLLGQCKLRRRSPKTKNGSHAPAVTEHVAVNHAAKAVTRDDPVAVVAVKVAMTAAVVAAVAAVEVTVLRAANVIDLTLMDKQQR